MSTKHLLRAAMVAASLVTIPSFAAAQDTATGTLTVTATVESSIALTFENDAAGVALTGAGTNAATMALGAISAYNTVSTPGVTRTVSATDFTVSSPFAVKVVKANSPSAQLHAGGGAGIGGRHEHLAHQRDGVDDVESEPRLERTATDRAVAHTMYLTVPFSASTGAISKVLNFTATAN